MQYIRCWVVLLVLVGCSSAPQAVPTLALLPTAANPPSTETPAAAIRPTLPPTFTPTPPPTAIPLNPTYTPFATLRPLAESVLGPPLQQPENYPVTVDLRGGGYALALSPPDAIQYMRRDGVYRLSLATIQPDGEMLTVHLVIRETVAAGDHTPDYCTGAGHTLPDQMGLCLGVSYNNGNLIATNPARDGIVSFGSLDPLVATVNTPLTDTLIPNTTSTRFNPAQASRLEIVIEGQALTQP